jgi:hypothetical protein
MLYEAFMAQKLLSRTLPDPTLGHRPSTLCCG